jgi:hypothetical protein
MPRGSKVADVENQLKREYGTGKAAAGKVYGTLNKLGLKHGNKNTAKGLEKAGTHDKPATIKARRRMGLGVGQERPARGR